MKSSAASTLVVLASLLLAGPVCNAEETSKLPNPTQVWNFQVYLDDNPIGSHAFAKYGKGSNYEMRIKADFEVKFLLFFSYTYMHSNREQWREGCLLSIESKTDDNGDLYEVVGSRDIDVFEVVANQQTRQLPACITTFSYWDPGFLTQTALLNSQTGEYMPVKITGPVADQRSDRGKTVDAQRYRIEGEAVDIRLWYSQAGDWLALESVLESKRTLRYLRSDQLP